jgi:hypothetical protein
MVRVNKPAFNLREKLSELQRPIGSKGNELMRSETVQDARDFLSAGRKNLMINGAMEVAQRATSVTGSGASGTVLTVDRMANHGSGATYNSSQETVPNGGMPGLPIKFKKYFKFFATTGANNCGVWQTIEDVRTVQGEHTFSFYARGTNPGGGSVEVDARQYFNGSADVDILVGNFVLTDKWERYVFTYTPPSLSSKSIGANSYHRLFIRQPNADNTTNSWQIEMTGWQLESGGNATEFEHRPYYEELALCQRYYQVWKASDSDFNGYEAATNSHNSGGVAYSTLLGNGSVHDGDDCHISMSLHVEMRDTPSISLTDARVMSGSTLYNNITIIQINNCSRKRFSAFVDNEGGMTAKDAVSLVLKGTSAKLALDAEL